MRRGRWRWPDWSARSPRRGLLLGLAGACALGACDVEKRHVGPDPPRSPPIAAVDPRGRTYASNRFEVSEGGRIFRWAGCGRCHTDPAQGYLDLADRRWRQGGSMPEIYRSIAQGAPGMRGYAGRLTPQQTWRIAGYVQGLADLKPSQRRRGNDALKGEPAGASWNGPIR